MIKDSFKRVQSKLACFAEREIFSLKGKRMFLAVALALVCLADTAQSLKQNMDPSVKPGDDFWQYAVGGWLKANPLDAQHPENGAFTELYELNNDRINKLVMADAEKKDLPQGSDGQKIGALYRLYMDSVSRNKMGYEPIMPYLKQVREVQTRDEVLRLMYALDACSLRPQSESESV